MVNNQERNWIVAIPVYNAISIVRRTFEYLVESGVPANVIHIYDDGSTDPSWRDLKKKCISLGGIYNRYDDNVGYTININRAFRDHDSKYVLLLNSDCLITLRNIEELVSVSECYPSIAAVGPLTNLGGKQSIALSARREWIYQNNSEIASASAFLEERMEWKFGRRPVVIPSINGFCALWRTAAVREIGYFDEVAFARGYGEEDDICYRLMLAGHLCAIAPWTFAVHFKTQSFSVEERNVRKLDARSTLDSIHDAAFVTAIIQHLDAHPLLRQINAIPIDA